MANDTVLDVTRKIIDLLDQLGPEERGRALSATLALIGNKPLPSPEEEELGNLPSRAMNWMKQYGVTMEQIQNSFHLNGSTMDVILAPIPGKSKREQTINAYLLTGIARLLINGEPSVDDKIARALCTQAGCYDNANHAKYLNEARSVLSGDKKKGWILTYPGLKEGAELVKAPVL